MKKKFMILMLLLLCGCSAKYQLTIDGSEITEEILFSIDQSKIIEEELAPDLSIYSKDSLNYLKNSNLYPIQDNQREIYEKTVTEEGNNLSFHLKYQYKQNNLEESRAINECFENKEVIVDDEKISIHLSGKFNCLNELNDKIEFKIKTNNKVQSANIAYGIFDNEYVWEINGTNSNNTDIQIELLTQSKIHYYGVRVALGIIILSLLGVILFAVIKISNRKNINEI